MVDRQWSYTHRQTDINFYYYYLHFVHYLQDPFVNNEQNASISLQVCIY